MKARRGGLASVDRRHLKCVVSAQNEDAAAARRRKRTFFWQKRPQGPGRGNRLNRAAARECSIARVSVRKFGAFHVERLEVPDIGGM